MSKEYCMTGSRIVPLSLKVTREEKDAICAEARKRGDTVSGTVHNLLYKGGLDTLLLIKKFDEKKEGGNNG
jgi:hypothetical protein